MKIIWALTDIFYLGYALIQLPDLLVAIYDYFKKKIGGRENRRPRITTITESSTDSPLSTNERGRNVTNKEADIGVEFEAKNNTN